MQGMKCGDRALKNGYPDLFSIAMAIYGVGELLSNKVQYGPMDLTGNPEFERRSQLGTCCSCSGHQLEGKIGSWEGGQEWNLLNEAHEVVGGGQLIM